MHEGIAWLAAALCFGLGDLLTTLVGTRRAGLVERAPVARRIGGAVPPVGRLVALKAASLGVAYVLTATLVPPETSALVPLCLAAVGVAVSGYNVGRIRATTA